MTSHPSPADPEHDLTARVGEQLAVARVRQGDVLALEMIFTAYRAELLALATQVTGTRVVAEEVVQDVFLVIWAKRERWQIATSLRGYLRRAVHNTAVRSAASHTRGGSRGIELADAEAVSPTDFTDHSANADGGVEYAELSERLEAAVRALPHRAREVFMLRRTEHLSNREIATRLGVSIKTVEVHMTRALAALRRHIADWLE